MIRRATVADVPAAAGIVNDAAEFGLMLPRSLASMYENVREFYVATALPDSEPDAPPPQDAFPPTAAPHAPHPSSPEERLVGVCGLSVVWANLAEVAALAVAADQRGRGLGKRLVLACLDEARRLGVRRVMTLTYERAFFEKLGFGVVDRQQLPLKVWSECVRCPKNQRCDEIAMIRELEDVPEAKAPDPPMPHVAPPEQYVVPITLTTTRSHLPAALPDHE